MPAPNLIRDAEFFTTVTAYSDSSYDVVIPNGETWEVSQFQGSGAYTSETTAQLVWDLDGVADVLASTHGDASFSLAEGCVGNGVKKLSIVLINNTANAQALGGKFQAAKVS